MNTTKSTKNMNTTKNTTNTTKNTTNMTKNMINMIKNITNTINTTTTRNMDMTLTSLNTKSMNIITNTTNMANHIMASLIITKSMESLITTKSMESLIITKNMESLITKSMERSIYWATTKAKNTAFTNTKANTKTRKKKFVDPFAKLKVIVPKEALEHEKKCHHLPILVGGKGILSTQTRSVMLMNNKPANRKKYNKVNGAGLLIDPFKLKATKKHLPVYGKFLKHVYDRTEYLQTMPLAPPPKQKKQKK